MREQHAPPAASPISETPVLPDTEAVPQVGRAARFLVWLAIAIPGLGLIAGVVGFCLFSHRSLYTPIAVAVFTPLAGLPLPGMAVLLRTGDRAEFRIAAPTLALAITAFIFLTLMFGVGLLYLASPILLLLAWGATYGPARIRSNSAAITGVVLVGILGYCVGASTVGEIGM